jgi:hypothetical protein
MRSVTRFSSLLVVLLVLISASSPLLATDLQEHEDLEGGTTTSLQNPFDGSEARHKITAYIQGDDAAFKQVTVKSKVGKEKMKRTFDATFQFIGFHHCDKALRSAEVWAAEVEVGGKIITTSMETKHSAYVLKSERAVVSKALNKWEQVFRESVYERQGSEASVFKKRTGPIYERLVSEEKVKSDRQARVCMKKFDKFTQWQMKERHEIHYFDIYEITKKEWHRPIGSNTDHLEMEPYFISDPREERVYARQEESPECSQEKHH